MPEPQSLATGGSSPGVGLVALMETLAESEQSVKVADWLARLGTFNYRPSDLTPQCSPNLYEFFGLDPAGATPDYMAALSMLSAANQASVSAILTPAGSRDTFTLRLEISRLDGTHRICWAEGRSEFNDSGELVAVTGVCQDVTEREAVAEQLQQAQKMEAVGQLTGGLAHDFNNLLAVIVGNLDLIEEALAEDPKTQRFAATALAAALKGAELTRQLLAFSRRQPLNPQKLDLNRLLAGMESMWQRTLGETIEVRLNQAANLWTTLADGPQVESAVLNLAINARDAMPDGGVLTVETRNVRLDESSGALEQHVPAGDYAMIAVSDTGCGIPPDLIASVFDPFFTTKEVGKGSGLGLSMVYGFAKQSGGHVKIYSEVGVGTTVRLYLPRAHQEAEVAEPAPATTAMPRSRNETVLVVEDNPDVRALAIHHLGDLGYSVIEAENGPLALAALESHGEIDLLFTDMVMPGGMTGIELSAMALKLHPHLKVLYTTGFAAAATGNSRFTVTGKLITKPYRKSALAVKVREVLDS
jgi:two-component system cell cycle sensor histidine kinase/response regulator CckA